MALSLLGHRKRLALYRALLSVRPAQLGVAVKTIVGIRRRNCVSLRGDIFWVDPVSLFGFQLLTAGIYERHMTSLLEAVLGPSDVFVDVGGHEGYFSVVAASLCSRGRVICIEPQQRLLPVIDANLRLNRATGVEVEARAIVDVPGSAQLYLRPSSVSGGSSLFRHWRLGKRRVDVPTTSLDELFVSNSVSHVRLIKVDCEGAESLVVVGARNVLAERHIDALAIEYHPTICGLESCARAHQLLVDSGYTCRNIGGPWLYHLPHLTETIRPLTRSHESGSRPSMPQFVCTA